MKNVLLLVKGLGRGGAEQILVSSALYGDHERFRYEVAYLLPWKTAFVSELQQHGIEAQCLDGARGPGWIRRLRGLARDRRIDLVHAHSPYPAVGARLAVPRSIPIVYTEHNVWERYHPGTYWGNLLTYPRNAQVFAVSDNVRSSIHFPRSLSFLKMPAVETLYHGPDPVDSIDPDSAVGVLEEFGIPPGAPVVGTVANLKPHKGYVHLLRAASLVRDEIPEVRFVVIGQGPLESELKRRAHDLGLNGHVIFTGYRDDVLRVASAFDVFALASIHEGLSIALIEAMSLGKPAVVTSVGGLPEVLENEIQGFIVPPADPRSLADRILRLVRDPLLRERQGRAASARAREFQIGHAVQRIEQVYEELLDGTS